MSSNIIGFIGAGHMNSAIIGGLLQTDSPNFHQKNIMVSAKTQVSADNIAKQYQVTTTTNNLEIIEQAAFIVIGVKPQQMQELLTQLADYDLSDTVLITIAAGIRIADYRKILGDEVTIVRAMPNMAAAYQSALTGIYSDDALDEEAQSIIDELFSAIGSTAWLEDETQIDGITALSGSGIAYFFRLMQAMMAAGERYGFEKDELYDIITLTALGAATITMESDNSTAYADLVAKIAVKGGTTEAAITEFEKGKIDTIISEAMQAVVNRSNELAHKLTENW